MSQKRIRKKRVEEKIIEKQQLPDYLVEDRHSIKDILKKNWKFLVIISLGIILIYLNAMRGDFVSDDYATILNNPEILTTADIIHNPTPVRLANWLIANMFGLVPIPFHLWSILFYIATVWVAFIFLNFILSKDLSRLVVLIFAFMPIHVEAVSWISGKPYLYIAMSIMIAFIAFIKYLEGGSWWYILVSCFAFGVVVLADPPRPFAVFPVIFLYLTIKNNKLFWKRFLKVLPWFGGAGVIFLLAFLPFMLGRIGVVNSGYNSSDSIFYNPFFQYPTGIPKYLQLMWLPFDLTLYHTMYTFPIWLNWLIFLNFLGILFYSYFRDKRVYFALVFLLLTLLPSMAPVKVSWLVAERYGFLPSLGFAILLGVTLELIWNKSRYIMGILLGIFLIFSAQRTFMRNIDWQTNHKLWVNTCQVSPNSHNAWNNIGDDYDKLKQYDNAVKGFTQSTIVKNNYADAYHNRANIFFKIGRLDLARDSYNTAVTISPGLFQTYLSLTQIDLMENKVQLALEHVQKAVQIDQNNPQSLYMMGVVYAQGGNLNVAEQIFRQILSSSPGFKPAKDALTAVLTAKT